ncbi:MAG: DsrE family protein [Xanthomonadales bacterium]|nr:DsrE family protein [Xanthomonadales bacterium]
MKILFIVNESPWGSSLGIVALRLVRAMVSNGVQVVAIYFRHDGVYHALRGRVCDAGTPPLQQAWLELAAEQGIELLLCSADARRRLETAPGTGFREAGLAKVLELMTRCDRVVTL